MQLRQSSTRMEYTAGSQCNYLELMQSRMREPGRNRPFADPCFSVGSFSECVAGINNLHFSNFRKCDRRFFFLSEKWQHSHLTFSWNLNTQTVPKKLLRNHQAITALFCKKRSTKQLSTVSQKIRERAWSEGVRTECALCWHNPSHFSHNTEPTTHSLLMTCKCCCCCCTQWSANKSDQQQDDYRMLRHCSRLCWVWYGARVKVHLYCITHAGPLETLKHLCVRFERQAGGFCCGHHRGTNRRWHTGELQDLQLHIWFMEATLFALLGATSVNISSVHEFGFITVTPDPNTDCCILNELADLPLGLEEKSLVWYCLKHGMFHFTWLMSQKFWATSLQDEEMWKRYFVDSYIWAQTDIKMWTNVHSGEVRSVC